MKSNFVLVIVICDAFGLVSEMILVSTLLAFELYRFVDKETRVE